MGGRIRAALLAALLLLTCACADMRPAGETVEVYYLCPEAEQNEGSLLRAEKRAVGGGENAIDAALAALAEQPKDTSLQRAVPQSVYVRSWSLRAGELRLNLSAGYAALGGAELSLARAAMALTLCGIREVSSVSFYVDGEAAETGLTRNDILLANTDMNPYNKRIKLYFAAPDGKLAYETRTVTLGRDEELARAVLGELLKGPETEKLRRTVPEGTRINSVTMENRVCVADLSAEFISDGGSLRLAASSVANTLTTLTGVLSVQILIDGRRVQEIYDPVEFDEKIVSAQSAG